MGMAATSLIVFLIICLFFIHVKNAAGSQLQLIARNCTNLSPGDGDAYMRNYLSVSEDVTHADLGTHFFTFGKPPNRVYVQTVCMEYLRSLQECQKCLTQAHSNMIGCLPKSTGGRVLLNHCFIRIENYSFVSEVMSPSDLTVCGSTKNDGLEFQNAVGIVTRKVLEKTPSVKEASDMENNNDTLAYSVAKCWGHSKNDSCEKCLNGAVVHAQTCFPSAEAYVLNAGCLLHYSDKQIWADASDVSLLDESGAAVAAMSYIFYGLKALVASSLAILCGIFLGKFIFTDKELNRPEMPEL